MSILKGYTVLDCSIAMAGPFAAQRLGDLGADVIKIEPVSGEWQRSEPAGGATRNKIDVSFLSLNRNKRSVAVDLKSRGGRKILERLAARADVFIQNYRPGVAARLGDYATLAKTNPKLIYVSMSGYGEDGPYAKRPGQDLLLQAMSGAMLSAGRDGDRTRRIDASRRRNCERRCHPRPDRCRNRTSQSEGRLQHAPGGSNCV